MQDPAAIDQVLKDGAGRAREIAAPILTKTYDIVGMLQS
jgi:tryptophanyl-tRNA synthetase